MAKYVFGFEHCGLVIVVRAGGAAIFRCRTSETDIGNDENIDDFVERHGGEVAAYQYLREVYRRNEQRRA